MDLRVDLSLPRIEHDQSLNPYVFGIRPVIRFHTHQVVHGLLLYRIFKLAPQVI